MARYFAMLHLPIPMKKAMTIPNAKSVVNKEWKAFEDVPAGDISRVRPTAEVTAKAKRMTKFVHFGSLVELCHAKICRTQFA